MNANPATSKLALLDDSPHGVYAVDFTQTIRYWNRSAERITGHKAENVLGLSCSQVLHNCSVEGEDSMCRDGCPSLQAIRENRMPPFCEVSMLCASGQRKVVVLMSLVLPESLAPETVLVHLFQELLDSPRLEQAPQIVEGEVTAIGLAQQNMELLTARELQVLRFTALGMTPNEIAGELHISYHTVRNYTAAVRRKLGARNKLSMVQIARYLNLL